MATTKMATTKKEAKPKSVDKHFFGDGNLVQMKYAFGEYPYGSLKFFDGYKTAEFDFSDVNTKTALAFLDNIEKMVVELRTAVQQMASIK